MSTESVSLIDEAGVRNLGVLARRALKLDHGALARFRNVDGDYCQVWFTTPFDSLVGRTFAGQASRDGMVCYADALATSAVTAIAARAKISEAYSDVPVELSAGVAADASWSTGPMPPADGWGHIDDIPVDVLQKLEAEGRALTESESGPMGPPQSLLDSVVLEVSATNGDSVGISSAETPAATQVSVTMRDVFALGAMGFIPAKPAAGEVVRVSQKGRWHRLDGRFGAVAATSGSIGVLPL